MTSYLLITVDQEAGLQKAHSICDDKTINPFDRTVFDLSTLDTKTVVKKSWGIEDIKKMQQKIILKPLNGEWKAVIITEAHLLTREAQNALLKTLEEPPLGTLLILITESEDAMLPTILSRCTIIPLETTTTLSDSQQKELLQELRMLSSAPIGDKLKKAETISKSRNEATAWLVRALYAYRVEMKKEYSPIIIHNIKLLQEAHTTIKSSNVTTRLILENYFLALTYE